MPVFYKKNLICINKFSTNIKIQTCITNYVAYSHLSYIWEFLRLRNRRIVALSLYMYDHSCVYLLLLKGIFLKLFYHFLLKGKYDKGRMLKKCQ